VANWLRVGYCQGNFNSDNCAAGGFTLDYGPFGFIDMFDPNYQPWTGGGHHFSFLNQPAAAERNFHVFCVALAPLLKLHPEYLSQLEEIRSGFTGVMQEQMQRMWAKKLGVENYDAALFEKLKMLMIETSLDYTIFFRELSEIPEDIEPLKKSFYIESMYKEKLLKSWSEWFEEWRVLIKATNKSSKELSKEMKLVNPKYSLREWFLVPAYQQAREGEYALIKEMQEVMIEPYAELSKEIEEKYYKRKPSKFFEIAGISHVSCSS
jgi:uncharacterized protein YdiU (UPF0061 family)